MKRVITTVLVISSALVLARAPLEAGDDKKIVAYYTAWSIYAREFPVSEIPADRLTHINYAFANIVGGECVLGDPWADVDKRYPDDPPDPPFRGNFGQLARLKERHPHVRTLISVGGWTWSGGFSDAAATAPARQRFARSCARSSTTPSPGCEERRPSGTATSPC